MLLVRHLGDLPFQELANGSVVTIGSFDGLHLGHRSILERLAAYHAELENMGVTRELLVETSARERGARGASPGCSCGSSSV